MADDNSTSVTVNFTKSKDYKVVSATGIWVTQTTDGHLMCNFLVESEIPPEKIILNVSEDGRFLSEKERIFSDGKPGYMREFVAGVLMTPSTAAIVANYLLEVSQGNQNKVSGDKSPESEPAMEA
jgi:hypothetical protein